MIPWVNWLRVVDTWFLEASERTNDGCIEEQRSAFLHSNETIKTINKMTSARDAEKHAMADLNDPGDPSWPNHAGVEDKPRSTPTHRAFRLDLCCATLISILLRAVAALI
jgi:hypothetical protein